MANFEEHKIAKGTNSSLQTFTKVNIRKKGLIRSRKSTKIQCCQKNLFFEYRGAKPYKWVLIEYLSWAMWCSQPFLQVKDPVRQGCWTIFGVVFLKSSGHLPCQVPSALLSISALWTGRQAGHYRHRIWKNWLKLIKCSKESSNCFNTLWKWSSISVISLVHATFCRFYLP